VHDLVDEAHADLAVGPEDAGGARLARLGDDLRGARRQLALDLLDPAWRSPSSCIQAIRPSMRPSRSAISVSVPPRTTGTSWAR
jgi:hypothetical protein